MFTDNPIESGTINARFPSEFSSLVPIVVIVFSENKEF